MKTSVPFVAIVGRTNVGKSTLFNALAQKRVAIVEDSPGVTRDRHYALIEHLGDPFTLVDTGGLVGEEDGQFRERVRQQTEAALQEADLVLGILDGISGPHPLDSEVVDILRRSGKRVRWVVNKCEKPLNEILTAEFYQLGLDDVLCISAAHRKGIKSLVSAIYEDLGLNRRIGDDTKFRRALSVESEQQDAALAHDDNAPIKVAILGRPNVGKSTLVNRILGEDRVITSEVAGTTRDSIDIPLTRDSRDYVLVDTAGLRKKARVDDGTIERFGNLRTLRSLARAHVAVLVIDATCGGPSDQDQKIAELIHERGTGLIVVVNKWDAVPKDHRTVKQFSDTIRRSLPFAPYAPILFVSALQGRRCPAVLQAARKVYESTRIRVSTSSLNDVLQAALRHRQPPVVRGEPVKLFFATQVSVSPPRFVLFFNHPKEIRPSYVRHLKSQLRKHFPFDGVDLKFQLRKRTSKAERIEMTANGSI